MTSTKKRKIVKYTPLQKKLFKQLKEDDNSWNNCEPEWLIKYLKENHDLWERGWFEQNTLSLIPTKNVNKRLFEFFIQTFRADEMDIERIDDCLAHSACGMQMSLTHAMQRIDASRPANSKIQKWAQDDYNGIVEEINKDATTIKFLKESGSKIGARIWWD